MVPIQEHEKKVTSNYGGTTSRSGTTLNQTTKSMKSYKILFKNNSFMAKLAKQDDKGSKGVIKGYVRVSNINEASTKIPLKTTRDRSDMLYKEAQPTAELLYKRNVPLGNNSMNISAPLETKTKRAILRAKLAKSFQQAHDGVCGNTKFAR